MANATYVQIVKLAEEFLKSSGHTSQEKRIKSRDVVNAIQSEIAKKQLDLGVARGTIFSYISHAANNDDNSSIASGGPWGGYWIDESESGETTPKPVEETQIEVEHGKPVSFNERDLYPLLHLWLSAKDFIAKDISNLKSGGKWGNPDVVGVKRVDLFGSVEIEIASCEVKLSEANWEQFIFEAISHKRFSNRSWFAYRISQAGK